MNKLIFRVYSWESNLLENLSLLNNDQMEFGQIRKLSNSDELGLSLVEVAEVSYQLLGVIGTIGGVFQLVDWLNSKLMSYKGTTILEVKGVRFDLSDKKEIEKLKLILEEHFGGSLDSQSK